MQRAGCEALGPNQRFMELDLFFGAHGLSDLTDPPHEKATVEESAMLFQE
jgi:hypothetical protein